MSNDCITRRNFLKVAAVSVAVPCLIQRNVLAQNGNPGANEKVVVGVVGAGYRIREIMNHPKLMRLQAICDVQDSQINLTIDGNSSAYRTYPGYKTLDSDTVKAVRYKHYREMFDNEKLDGVFITTPTHVRARITLFALAAGFDVYGEKPFALTTELRNKDVPLLMPFASTSGSINAVLRCVRFPNGKIRQRSRQQSPIHAT